jgi:DNA repair exonuclease SbcCD nuclease subunit
VGEHNVRFVCAGDLHLGSGPDLHPDGARARLLEQEQVLAEIVDAANELEAPLLWCGDAWEHRRPTPAQVLAFERQMQRIDKNGGIAITGNHDVEAFDEPTGYDLVDWSGINVDRPVFVGGHHYTVACLPWAPPHRVVELGETADRDRIHERLAEGLLDIARGLFAEMPTGGARILLGHWSISGAGLPSGMPTDQLREPVLPLDELAAIGFDAVVFGHIHKPQLLSAPDTPPIFYVGSPLPLNFGEAQGEHSAWLLEINETTGRASAYRLPLEYPELQTIDTAAVTLAGGVEVEHRDVTANATVKIRVAATEEQARRLDLAQLKSDLILARGARHVWSIQLEVDKPELQRGATVDEGLDDLETFEWWIEESEGGFAEPFERRLRDRHAAIVEGRL